MVEWSLRATDRPQVKGWLLVKQGPLGQPQPVALAKRQGWVTWAAYQNSVTAVQQACAFTARGHTSLPSSRPLWVPGQGWMNVPGAGGGCASLPPSVMENWGLGCMAPSCVAWVGVSSLSVGVLLRHHGDASLGLRAGSAALPSKRTQCVPSCPLRMKDSSPPGLPGAHLCFGTTSSGI